jgi:hypothetical protein
VSVPLFGSSIDGAPGSAAGAGSTGRRSAWRVVVEVASSEPGPVLPRHRRLRVLSEKPFADRPPVRERDRRIRRAHRPNVAVEHRDPPAPVGECETVLERAVALDQVCVSIAISLGASS